MSFFWCVNVSNCHPLKFAFQDGGLITAALIFTLDMVVFWLSLLSPRD